MGKDKTYSKEEIRQKLAAELPHWSLKDGHITRTYKTHGWKATLMAVNTIGHLAEVAWHHPDIHASYSAVEVSLQSHDVGGITDRDFELARKIEDIITWQPSTEDGALTGIPEGNARFAYIKHEN